MHFTLDTEKCVQYLCTLFSRGENYLSTPLLQRLFIHAYERAHLPYISLGNIRQVTVTLTVNNLHSVKMQNFDKG